MPDPCGLSKAKQGTALHFTTLYRKLSYVVGRYCCYCNYCSWYSMNFFFRDRRAPYSHIWWLTLLAMDSNAAAYALNRGKNEHFLLQLFVWLFVCFFNSCCELFSGFCARICFHLSVQVFCISTFGLFVTFAIGLYAVCLI